MSAPFREAFDDKDDIGRKITIAVMSLGALCTLVVTIALWIFTARVEDNVQAQINNLRASLISNESPLVSKYEFNAKYQTSEQEHVNLQRQVDDLKRFTENERDLIDKLQDLIAEERAKRR